METIKLFKNIPKENEQDVLRSLNARQITFTKDMTILSNLSNTNEVGMIISGSASLIRIDYNGNRSIVADLKKSDLFGGCFSDYMNEEMSVIATSDCDVLFVEYDRLLGKNGKRTKYHEILIENMIEIMMQKINAYNRRIEVLNKRTIRDKLLEYFHILEKEQSSNRIVLPFTYTLLADFLSVDRSAMMREIKNLKDERIIEANGKTVTLIYR
ncbi:MAG TPA: Crp/Fnr family transcriptional regulator [Firmicutes bacterium]|nr:Crp/Fnr family transcriptional regulator [Bacillota bacterium]